MFGIIQLKLRPQNLRTSDPLNYDYLNLDQVTDKQENIIFQSK